jgi:hypothetical protein
MKKSKKVEESRKIKFMYSEEDAPCFYAHGARGGPTSIYDFRIDFYSERRRDPNIEILSENNSKRVSSFSQTDEEYDKYVVVDRKIQVSVILSFPAAKELASWLSKRLKQYEDLVKSAEEEGSP